MVIDTSAVLAILLQEPDAEYYARVIAEDPRRLISAFSLLEGSVVITARKGAAAARELDPLIQRGHLEVVSLNQEQAELARECWVTYGKGRHPAGLNLGDCCSYALAQVSGEPLLFKGKHFSQTDVRTV